MGGGGVQPWVVVCLSDHWEETENLDIALITVTSKNLKVNSSLLGAPVHET